MLIYSAAMVNATPNIQYIHVYTCNFDEYVSITAIHLMLSEMVLLEILSAKATTLSNQVWVCGPS